MNWRWIGGELDELDARTDKNIKQNNELIDKIDKELDTKNNQNDEFSLLQIKPMLIGKKGTNVSISKYKNDNLLFSYSSQVLGNGEIDGIKYIMYVDPLKFKREATQEISKSPNSKVIVIGNGDGDLPIILGGQ